jgi:hypothetical protein
MVARIFEIWTPIGNGEQDTEERYNNKKNHQKKAEILIFFTIIYYIILCDIITYILRTRTAKKEKRTNLLLPLCTD